MVQNVKVTSKVYSEINKKIKRLDPQWAYP